MSKRVVLYARISVTKEESVAVKHQLLKGRELAALHDWTVVGEFVDDGVSASANTPEKRAGWRALLDSPEEYDAVVIYKVDRLARRAMDFLRADEMLQKRGAGLVAVADPVDMTTAQGRAFAVMLSVFAELEAATISARVTAARGYLLKNGRVVGGTVPYGWKALDNPDGPGKVLAIDPERIEWVRGMVEKAQRGRSLHSICQWLDAAGAPLPKASQTNRKEGTGWRYSTVDNLLRNPLLAGMTAYNKGSKSKERGAEVLRDDETGLPIVNSAVAIMSADAWRALVAGLDNRDSPQARPHAMRAKTSALLSGLVYCGDERHGDDHPRMWRGTTQGRPHMTCPECHMVISNFEDILIEEFLRQKGDQMRWTLVEEVHASGADVLPEIEHRLTELGVLINAATDKVERKRLRKEQDTLLDLRDEKRAEPGKTVQRWNEGDATFGVLWERAGDDIDERRATLEDAVERIVVRRGPPGRRTPAQVLARLDIAWKRPEEMGPIERPTNEELAEFAEFEPYSAKETP